MSENTILTNEVIKEPELPETLFEETETAPAEGTAGEEKKAPEESQTDEGKGAPSAENGNHTEEEPGATIRIKYNGEEKDISIEEARTLAQKGMNYDKVREERDRNRSAYDYLQAEAKKQNISVEEFIGKAKEKSIDELISQRVEKLRGEDEDASEEILRRLARAELLEEEARQKKESERAQNEREIENWLSLYRVAPELKGEDGNPNIPDEIFEIMKEGKTPLEAYYTFKLKTIAAQKKTEEARKTAEKKSVGSVKGSANETHDDFLEGFLGN